MAKLKSGTRIYGNATVDSALTITSGPTLIGTGTSTGTASQPLQVGSATTQLGAYVSGNLGVGRTNPSSKLEVLGGASLYSTNTAAVASLSASNSGVFDLTSYFATGATMRFILADSGGNNTERARFDASGNLGIGTTNPTTKLHVYGATGNQQLRIQTAQSTASAELDLISGSSQSAFIDYGPNSLFFRNTDATGSVLSTNAVINSSGSVGIGTTNPGTKLQVQDGVLSVYNGPSGAITTSIQLFSSPISQSNGTGQRIEFRSDVVNAYIEGVRDSAAGPSMSMRLGVYQTEAIRILSNGNVGIGTTNPTSALHVQGTGQFVAASSSSSTSNSAIYANTPLQTVSAFFGQLTSTSGLTGNQYSTAIRFNGSNIAWGDISYYPNQGGQGHFRFSLAANTVDTTPDAKVGVGELYSAGSVGIGTTNPISNLHINSTTARSIVFTGDTGSSYLVMGNKDSGGTTGPVFIQSGNRNLIFGVGDSFTSATAGTNTEYMRLDSSGNLGIGTASILGKFSIQASSNTSFSVRDSTSVTGTSGILLENWTSPQAPIGGTIPFAIRASQFQFGTDNGAGVFVERARIDANGRLGLGISIPTSTLHVVGNSLVTGVGTFNKLLATDVGTFVTGVNIRNTNNSGGVLINYASGAASENTLSIPNLTANTGIAVTGQNQTFTGTQTFGSITASGTISFSGNTTLSGLAVNIIPTNTGSTFTIGTTQGTGNIVLGQSTRTQQTDIQAGASGVGTTKTINLGTGGLSGSFTQINIGPGPSAGVGTVAINAGTNVGIGTTNPTSRLHIAGGTATAGTSPLEIAAGTLLTTPESDTFEYDGRLLYHTQNDTTNGNKRALIPEVQFIRNPSNVAIASTASPGTSIFGATARPALLAGNFYDVEMVLFFAKGTSNGTATFQAALSTGNFTTANILANNAATNVVINATTSPITIFTSASLTTNTQLGITFRGIVQPASNSRLDMLLYNSVGVTTVYNNSYLRVSCVGTASSIGNFA